MTPRPVTSADLEQHPIARVMEYAATRTENHGRFTLKELKRDLGMSDEEFALATHCGTPLKQSRPGGEEYQIHLEAFISYLDLVEMREARQQALEAQRSSQEAYVLARKALWVSAALAVVSIITQVVAWFV